MGNRVEKYYSLLRAKGREAALIINPENRRYLSGFTGTSGYLFLAEQQAFLITDSRYTEQAGAQAPEFLIVQHTGPWEDKLAELIEKQQIGEVIVEKEHVTIGQFNRLKAKIPTVSWLAEEDVAEGLRIRKDSQELNSLRHAVALADQGFDHILQFIQPGMTEAELSLELEFYLRRAGAEKAAFDFIVASGLRSALPHGVATNKQVKIGEQVKMDFGAVYQGYHSDITRTVFLGKATERFKAIYELVLEAQMAAIAAVAPGKQAKEIDRVARDIITAQGYGENFGHGLGHGVGLVIHEGPRVSPTGEEVLEPGMVLTVEPGIYLADWGGVRIEDIVLVTEAGHEVLTKASKALVELSF